MLRKHKFQITTKIDETPDFRLQVSREKFTSNLSISMLRPTSFHKVAVELEPEYFGVKEN